MASRSEILKALDGEEAYQLDRWGADAHERTCDEWIMYISQYAQEAMALTVHGDEETARHQIRKVASMCFNCMEQHGVPQRKGYER